MQKRVWISVLVVLLLMGGVTAVQAQINGSIRGTIYNDTNVDGVCGAGDPVVSGVPIQFVHQNGHTITLTSGDDGTYGLAGVSQGTWAVAVVAAAGWQPTSLSPILVTLTADVNSVSGVNFCVVQGTATVTPRPTATPFPTATPLPPGATPPPPTTLPESGSALPPFLLAAAAAGVVLLVAGMALMVRERRSTS